MKLYEINEEILRLTDQISVDEETGEILCDMDAITAGIEALQMERRSILEYLAKESIQISDKISFLSLKVQFS